MGWDKVIVPDLSGRYLLCAFYQDSSVAIVTATEVAVNLVAEMFV